MARGVPVNPETRAEIIRLCDSGMARNEIARQVGVSTGVVSRICAAAGRDFKRTQVEEATKARAVDLAAELATLSAGMAAVAKQELDRARKPYIVYAFGGMSNDYSQHELPLPPAEAVRSMQTTAAVAHDKIVKFLDRQVDGAQTVAESLLDRIEEGLSKFDDGDDDDIAQ